MKKYILICLIGLSVISCDKAGDIYSDVNIAPEILVKKQGGAEFVQEFVDSLKIEKKSYIFDYEIDDEQKSLTASITCDNNTTDIVSEENKIYLTPTDLGENIINISVTDGFNVTTETQVKIGAFDNLPPVAKISMETTDAILSKYERKFDASGSFDGDAKFGGTITMYQYRIETQAIITTTENFIEHIFPQAGSIQIAVRVMDNNNVWSEEITERFSIN